jgi:hypothetical protein
MYCVMATFKSSIVWGLFEYTEFFIAQTFWSPCIAPVLHKTMLTERYWNNNHKLKPKYSWGKPVSTSLGTTQIWQSLTGIRNRARKLKIGQLTHQSHLLGASAKLRKATISYVMSVCPSVRSHGITWFLLDGFSWNLIFEYFFKSVEKIKVPLNREWITGTLHEGRYAFLIVSHSFHLRMRNMSKKDCRETQKTQIFWSINFS